MQKQKKDEFERGSGGRERALWISVIQQAIEDYQHDPLSSNRANGQQTIRALADRAKYWLFISKLKTIGSLAWICNELEIPIENIRKKILADKYQYTIKKESYQKCADFRYNNHCYPAPPEGLPVGLRGFDTF